MNDFWQNYRSLADRLLFGDGGRALQPMSAYGRMTARLDRGDSDFKADGELISDELTAALKRIAITSARAS